MSVIFWRRGSGPVDPGRWDGLRESDGRLRRARRGVTGGSRWVIGDSLKSPVLMMLLIVDYSPVLLLFTAAHLSFFFSVEDPDSGVGYLMDQVGITVEWGFWENLKERRVKW
ncbi:hypothetical protein SLA2020_085040 [Shorea laevis]